MMAVTSPVEHDTKGLTNGHPLLSDLSERAGKILGVFEDLPVDIQMDGLDVLQNVVNSVMQKITRGRVTAVKFVPVEGSAVAGQNIILNANATVKEEPIENIWGNSSQDNQTDSTLPNQSKNRQNTTVIQVNHDHNNMETNQDITKNVSDAVVSSHKTDKSPQGKVKTLKKGKKKVFDGLSNNASAEGSKTKQGKKTSKRSPKAKLLKSVSKAKGKTTPGEVKGLAGDIKATNQDPEKCTQDVSAVDSSKNDRMVTPEPDINMAVPDSDVNLPQKFQANSPKSTCNAEVLALIPDKMRVIPPEKRKRRVARQVPGRFQCQFCTYSSDKKFHFEAHLIIHTGEKRFCCDKCDKVFTAASSLKRHIMAHEGVKPHECPICGRTFTDMAGLRTHSVVHTGERLYGCEQCEKVYTNSANLSRHRRVHTGEMPYSCKVPECEARFRDLSSLKLHNLKHTGEKPYTCEFCAMKFKTSSDYLRHKRSHTNERNYECELCGKKFIQGWHLKQHAKMHTDTRPWSCDLCDKKFRSKASLKHHTKWHAGIKEYKCDTCDKLFSTKKYLEAHQVIHTKLKPYKCTTCDTYFNQVSNLKRHERMHSDVRRYKCHFCPKAFKYINSWRYHEGIHKGDMLTCEKCGVSMRSKQGLKAHKCSPTAMERQITAGNLASGTVNEFESFIQHTRDYDGDTDLEDLDEDERREILEAQEVTYAYEENDTDFTNKTVACNGNTTEKLTIKPLKIKLPKLPLTVKQVPMRSSSKGRKRKQHAPKKSAVKKKVNHLQINNEIVNNDDDGTRAIEIKTEPLDRDELDLGCAVGGTNNVEVESHCTVQAAEEQLEKDTETNGSGSGDYVLNGGTANISANQLHEANTSSDHNRNSPELDLVTSRDHLQENVSECNGIIMNGNHTASALSEPVDLNPCFGKTPRFSRPVEKSVGFVGDGSVPMCSMDDMSLMKDAYVSGELNGE